MSLTFKVTPEYKKSTYSNEYWVKEFDGVEVCLIISTQWRWGEFNIHLDDSEDITEFKKTNPLIINDYCGEFIQTVDGCDVTHEIKDIERLSEDIKKAVHYDIYRYDNDDILYDECVLEEEKGWLLDETVYEIYNGFILE